MDDGYFACGVVAAFVVFILLFIAHSFGYDSAEEDYRQRAIDASVAEWQIDQDGHREFHFIKE